MLVNCIAAYKKRKQKHHIYYIKCDLRTLNILRTLSFSLNLSRFSFSFFSLSLSFSRSFSFFFSFSSLSLCFAASSNTFSLSRDFSRFSLLFVGNLNDFVFFDFEGLLAKIDLLIWIHLIFTVYFLQ